MVPRPNARVKAALLRAGLPPTAMLVAASATAAGLGYLWTIITGRLLPAAEYADFSAAASIIYFAATTMAPCSQTLAYFTASYVAAGDPDSALELERRALEFLAGAGIVVIIVSALASSPLAALLHFRSRLSVVLAAASAAAVGPLHVKRGRLLGLQQFGRYSWNITAELIVRLLLAMLLLLLAASASASLAAYLVAVLGAMAFADWRKGDLRAVDVPGVLRYLMPVFAYTIIYAAFQNIDVLIVKRLFSPADAGIYGAASFLSRAGGMLVMPFVAFAVPNLVEALDDPAEVRRRFLRICVQYGVLATATVAVIGWGSRIIITLLFGQGYGPAAGLLLPLSTAIALSGLTFLVCQLPVATKRFAFVKWYALGLLVEIAGLAGFHHKLIEIPLVLIVANVITMALMIPHLRTRPDEETGGPRSIL
jgi:O-antigen/teichoic acid export membrane protein